MLIATEVLLVSSELWHSDIKITTALARACIEERFHGLSPLQEIICIGEGWDNKVFLVNDLVIFRFPRREVAVQLMERENRVLKNICSRFSIQTPKPKYIGKPSEHYRYPFHGYPIIKGTSICHATITNEERMESIRPLAIFLKELHSITENQALLIGAAPQIFDRTETDRLIHDLKERLIKAVKKNIFQINEKCFYEEMLIAEKNKLDFSEKVLVHGDLYCRHLIFDKGKLSGIIDWGDTGINHCSVDLSVIFSFYPKSCHGLFFSIYGDVDENTLIHARFLALYSSFTLMVYAHDTADDLLFKEAKESLLRINLNILKGGSV